MHILMPTIYCTGYKLSFKWTYTFPTPLFHMLQKTSHFVYTFHFLPKTKYCNMVEICFENSIFWLSNLSLNEQFTDTSLNSWAIKLAIVSRIWIKHLFILIVWARLDFDPALIQKVYLFHDHYLQYLQESK